MNNINSSSSSSSSITDLTRSITSLFAGTNTINTNPIHADADADAESAPTTTVAAAADTDINGGDRDLVELSGVNITALIESYTNELDDSELPAVTSAAAGIDANIAAESDQSESESDNTDNTSINSNTTDNNNNPTTAAISASATTTAATAINNHRLISILTARDQLDNVSSGGSGSILQYDDTVEMNQLLSNTTNKGNNRGRNKRKRGRPGRLPNSKLTPALESRMGLANSAYINNKLSESIKILKSIITECPTAPGPYHTLGLIYEEQQQSNKSIQAYMLAAHFSSSTNNNNIITSTSTSTNNTTQPSISTIELWLRVSKLAYEHNEYKQCIYSINKVLKLNRQYNNELLSLSDQYSIEYLKAISLMNLLEYNRAIEQLNLLYTLYYKLNPGTGTGTNTVLINPILVKELATAYHSIGLISKSIQTIEDYIKQYSNKINNTNNNNNNNNNNNTADSSIDLTLLNMLCELYLESKSYTELLDLIRLVQNFHSSSKLPTEIRIKYAIAILYSSTVSTTTVTAATTTVIPSISTAESILNELFTLTIEDYSDLYSDVAEAYTAIKQFNSAIQIYQQLQSIESANNSTLWLRLAYCIRSSSNNSLESIPQCIELYEKVLAEDESNISVKLQLSELYNLIGETEKALNISKFNSNSNTTTSNNNTIQANNNNNIDNTILAQLSIDIIPIDSKLIIQTETELKLLLQLSQMLIQNQQYSQYINQCFKRIIATLHAALGYNIIENTNNNSNSNIGNTNINIKSETVSAIVLDSTINNTAESTDSSTTTTAAHNRSHQLHVISHRLSITSDFIQHILLAAKTLSYYQLTKSALILLQQCENRLLSTFHSTVAIKSDLRELRYLIVGLCFNLNSEWELAYQYCRFVLEENPYSFHIGSLFNTILHHLQWDRKCLTFLDRTLIKYSDSAVLLILLAHSNLMHQSFEIAYQQYLRAHTLIHYTNNNNTDTNNNNNTGTVIYPYIYLFLGLSRLQLALNRRFTTDVNKRNSELIASFSLIYKYCSLSKFNSESQYNLARALHSINLVSLAKIYYEKVLAATNTNIDSNNNNEFVRSAAHNLAQIYRNSGATELARRLYQQYCVI